MKLIFLDIDGVMNNYKCELSDKHDSLAFDEESVKLLKKLIEKTKAKLIISSTWRIGETLETLNSKVLKHYKLDKHVIDFTPALTETIRGEEIKLVLEKYDDVEKFIIIDDDQDMGELLPYLIRTKTSKGFTNKEYQEALKKLT